MGIFTKIILGDLIGETVTLVITDINGLTRVVGQLERDQWNIAFSVVHDSGIRIQFETYHVKTLHVDAQGISIDIGKQAE